VIGFYARRSNDIVDVTACPILSPKLEAALDDVRSELRRVHRAAELELVESREGVLIGAPPELFRANSISPEALDGAARFVDPAFAALAPEDGQGDHFVSPESFTQSHGAGNSALVGDLRVIVDELQPSTILELYAGSGNLTRALVADGRSVLAVERDPRSADLFARAFAGVPRDPRSVEDAVLELQRGPKSFDLIVADPPREGLPEPVRQGIVALHPRAMVLVSCDLAAFARDVGWFAKRGFALDRVRLYDFYPQTDHAEVLGRLTPDAAPMP
jgi:tRNA/tmRNA/rRNA uracil-C5-methylase (TrmA/RlmC/RlmD family)